MNESPTTETGLMESGKRMLQTLSRFLACRVELFLVELKEERVRAVVALLLIVAGGICALMTLVLLTVMIVILFWDQYRLPVLAVLTAAYATGAVSAFVSLRRRLRRWEGFAASLEQIKKDCACLETKN